MYYSQCPWKYDYMNKIKIQERIILSSMDLKNWRNSIVTKQSFHQVNKIKQFQVERCSVDTSNNSSHLCILSVRFKCTKLKFIYWLILKSNVMKTARAWNVNIVAFLFKCETNVSRRHLEVYKTIFIKTESLIALNNTIRFR